MASISGTLVNQVVPFGGGADSTGGLNETYTIAVTGTWAAGDTWVLTFTDSLSGTQTSVGFGIASGVQGVYCYTYSQKVYVLGGPNVYMSAVDEPTIWNDVTGLGNGQVELDNRFGTPEPVVSMSAYQGKLAFFMHDNVQIFNINADLTQWQLFQVLPNIGTPSPNSVQSLGDLDVLFLYYTGIRSLRARDTVLNAFVNDLGSPIDLLVQAAIQAGGNAVLTGACSIIEPTNNRYWLYLNGLVYVFSYFASNKILAWSTYVPKDSAGGTFIPTKFCVFNGQVFARGTDSNGNDAVFQYGGTDNNTYDTTVMTVQTPFLDLRTAATGKLASGVDCIINEGITTSTTFTVGISLDPVPLTTVFTDSYVNAVSSFDLGIQPTVGQGTHYAMRAVTTGTGPALLSGLLYHYQGAEEK